MNDKQNRNKSMLNILLTTLLFTFVLGVFMPLLIGILSSETPLGEFMKNEIRTIVFDTIIIFILLFMFVLIAFVKSKQEQTRDRKAKIEK